MRFHMEKIKELTAKIEPFDTFWEAPQNVEKGFHSFATFYRHNYLSYIPSDKKSRILVISCGAGYFVNFLQQLGYTNVLGIDSDPEKVKYGIEKKLSCKTAHAFTFFDKKTEAYDLIFLEQEINHLTKKEILRFLELSYNGLATEGTLILHSLNGANPLTGSEALAQNFDHYNTFTEYSLKQILEYANFKQIKVIPLKLYIFYKNPLNYLGIFLNTCLLYTSPSPRD